MRYALRLLSLVLTIRRQQADLLQYAQQQAEFYTVQFYFNFQYRCKIVFSLPSGITLALGDFVFTNLALDAEIYSGGKRMIQVYAKADAAGRVEELGSSVFLKDPTGWTLIDEGEGDRYAHAQGNYLDKPLTEEDGTHNYMLDGSTIREATSEEKEAEKAAFPQPEPSREEQLEAQVAALQSQVDALLGVSE